MVQTIVNSFDTLVTNLKMVKVEWCLEYDLQTVILISYRTPMNKRMRWSC